MADSQNQSNSSTTPQAGQNSQSQRSNTKNRGQNNRGRGRGRGRGGGRGGSKNKGKNNANSQQNGHPAQPSPTNSSNQAENSISGQNAGLNRRSRESSQSQQTNRNQGYAAEFSQNSQTQVGPSSMQNYSQNGHQNGHGRARRNNNQYYEKSTQNQQNYHSGSQNFQHPQNSSQSHGSSSHHDQHYQHHGDRSYQGTRQNRHHDESSGYQGFDLRRQIDQGRGHGGSGWQASSGGKQPAQERHDAFRDNGYGSGDISSRLGQRQYRDNNDVYNFQNGSNSQQDADPTRSGVKVVSGSYQNRGGGRREYRPLPNARDLQNSPSYHQEHSTSSYTSQNRQPLNPNAPPPLTNNHSLNQRLHEQRGLNYQSEARYGHYTHSHVEDVVNLVVSHQRKKNERNKPKPSGPRKQYRQQQRDEQGQESSKSKQTRSRRQAYAKPTTDDEEEVSRRLASDCSITDTDQMPLREKLIYQLTKLKYECLICMNNVKKEQAIWSCSTCHAMFHIFCIKKWAKNSLDQQTRDLDPNEKKEPFWRCPGCQTQTKEKPPSQYYCFCGKHKDPVPTFGRTPHSCGQICDRKSKICDHKCASLCHPGPCPECENYRTQTCPCDNQATRMIRCQDAVHDSFTCGEVCGRLLDCGEHFCVRTCHESDCAPCEVKIDLECWSHGTEKEFACNQDEGYSCQLPCEMKLDCGHLCTRICHDEPCGECSINLNKFCHCGKESYDDWTCAEDRRSCNRKCNRKKLCGCVCEEICHGGECRPCPEDSMQSQKKCRCGKNKVRISCKDLVLEGGVATCHRVCKAVSKCGNPRHRCKNNCCVEDHNAACIIPCGSKLSCGTHFCPEACHYGRACMPCSNITWTELSCRCGNNKILPPIACGADVMISCMRPCPIKRDCGHRIAHDCHDMRQDCPPCTHMVEKPCVCGKVSNVKIQCWRREQDVSCGKMCVDILPCGHKCPKACHNHKDEAIDCQLPCFKLRADCNHLCGKECHYPKPCPNHQYCMQRVRVTCLCGFQQKTLDCGAPEYQTNSNSVFRHRQTYYKLAKARTFRNKEKVPENLKFAVLQCDDTCAHNQRCNALREALEIPEARGDVTYEEWMVNYGKKNMKFVKSLEEIFAKMIIDSHHSVSKMCFHQFDPMNRDKRTLVHELAALYGLEGCSYNKEPNRYPHIYTPATRANGRLPKRLLSDVIENGADIV